VAIEEPAATPLTVLLRPQNGSVETPASVVIPAGQTEAKFEFAGRRAGVEELMVEPADARFEAVHVRLQVAAPASLQLALAGGDFQTVRAGTPLAQPVQVRVTDDNNLPYPGVFVAATVTAGGAVQPASVQTDENGIASFRWTPGSGAENELRATIAGGEAIVATALSRPALANGGVVNAASYAPGLTPGGIGTVFGLNLAGSGTAEVLVNGRATQVFYSNTRQVNFHVPYETQTGTAQVMVRTGVGTSEAATVAVSAVQPGIFFDPPTGFGAVTVAGTGQVTQVRPAARGETIEIYATGLGLVQQQANGFRTTLATPQVLIGGIASRVTFSGLAPGYTGLYQINAEVPVGAPTGVQPLVATADGVRSNQTTIQIR
jgi:uncharacterized protein (TIGR03437 family)